jgi:ElaB/YqjD/DUF883 family membrane-anchored ribosome-binding protein
MDEQKPYEGGAANTPPFPPDPPKSSEFHEPESASAPSVNPWDGLDEAEDDLLDTVADDDEPWARPIGRDERREARGSRHGERRRAVHRGFERFAERLEDTAERFGRLAEEQLQGDGPRGRAGEVALSAASWLDDTADYLRTADLPKLQRDLENRVRDRPIQTLLIAAGAGWLLGKIMR